MQRTFALAIVALFVAAAIPSVQATMPPPQEYQYMPGPYITTIWCSSDEHSIVPLEGKEPSDYERPEDPDDPLDPVMRPVGGIDGWAWSGEPECAPHDVYNAGREAQGQERVDGGYGGTAYELTTDHLNTLLTSETDDDNFGAANSYQYLTITREAKNEEGNYLRETVDGCGTVGLTIPSDPLRHWQSTEDDPRYYAWVFIDAVGVVVDDLTVCFSSTGTVRGTFSAPGA